ncbi:MAG: hypothetical protein IH611_00890, partial [Deltaproteobacteria bacterium]|nr:hypothetical protein [Deltaproteobacteria bacterium]
GQNSPGGTTHMAMEAFRKQAKLDMKMVPYGGGASEVVTALLGKHVDVGVIHPQEGKEFVAAGKLRPLVIFSKKRAKALPDVPTAIEKGYEVDIAVTKGISGPAGLPDDIVKKLHDAFKKTMDDKDFLAAAKNTGDLEYLDYMDGKEITAFLQDMYNDLKPIIGELGLSKKK